jgi:Zn ribbon nucleic-acid-binding protein
MTKNWERTTHGYLICPHCGKTGYTLGRWLEAHKQHAECWVCGKVVTARGLKIHARIHARE